MDSDSSYEDRSEVGEEDSSADDDVGVEILRSLNGESNIVTKSRDARLDPTTEKNTMKTRGERWECLEGHYNDQYLNLLNESSAHATKDAKDDLGSTQIGLTNWSSMEKEQFFLALSLRSKADVLGIATSIGSKSELEVSEYLRWLEGEDRNRHLYAGQVNNVSQAEIPAAAELSFECEALLERAADALAVYQDKFDYAIGEQIHHDRWLIDHVQAEAYDNLADNAEDDNSLDDSPFNRPPIPAAGLFKLSSWLSLTERVFMNSDPARSENRWVTHAARDEVPGITQAAISDLYDLAIYRLRKVMQTSIFCAESRIRSTSDRGFTVKALVKEQDVTAAISTLGVEKDSSQYWLSLARRNQLRVVDDHGTKGRGRRAILNYDEVECILSEAAGPRRGRRSISRSSGSSSLPEDTDLLEEHDVSDGIDDTNVHSSEQSAEEPSCRQDGQPWYPSLRKDRTMVTNNTKRRKHDPETSSAESEEEGLCDLRDDQDRHLDILDGLHSRREELQLYQQLGWGMPEDIKLASIEEMKAQEEVLGMTQRKAKPDLLDWRDSILSYSESWERHGRGLDEEQFAENRKPAKRRKLADTGTQQDLPFRTPRS
jgi:RNA polymerase I-specific transcription initiation factor RRN5